MRGLILFAGIIPEEKTAFSSANSELKAEFKPLLLGAGSGSTGYLDTKYSPTTDGINYTLNSACIGVFVSDNLAIDAPVIYSGNDNYGSNSLIFPRTTSNTLDGQINNDDFNRVSQSNLNSIGFFSVKRINASSVSVYKKL